MNESILDETSVGSTFSLKKETSCSARMPSIESIGHVSEKGTDILIIDWIADQQNNHLPERGNSLDIKEASSPVAKPEKRSEESSKKLNRKTHRSEDPSTVAFKQSQRILRKEAKRISMKEVISNTFSASSPPSFFSNEESMVSFSSPALSLSSPWSPEIANDITSQFLSTVEEKKKRKFEQLISSSSSKSSPIRAYASEGSDAIACNDDELIICDEDANMGPPFSPDDPLLLPDDSSWMVSTDISSGSKRLGEATEEKSQQQEELFEKDRIAALSRKHRIWEMQRQKRDTVNTLKSLSTTSTQNKSSLLPLATVGAKTTGISDPSPETSVYFTTLTPLHRMRCTNDQSVSQSNLSMDDISMIQRINSFGKTAAQNMIVFTSTSKKEK